MEETEKMSLPPFSVIGDGRLTPEQWAAEKTCTDPWLEGEALEVAVKLGLCLELGDHVRVHSVGGPGTGADVPDSSVMLAVVGRIALAGAHYLGHAVARHGPGPNEDWAVYILPTHLAAWRRPKRAQHS